MDYEGNIQKQAIVLENKISHCFHTILSFVSSHVDLSNPGTKKIPKTAWYKKRLGMSSIAALPNMRHQNLFEKMIKE